MNDTIEKFDDRTEYRRAGKLHRDNDLPAIEWANGTKYWFLNGKMHRTVGPAIEETNGDKSWYQNGNCHRTDGAGIEWANGSKFWFLNGQLHRLDGPAIERASGYKAWYLNGKKLTEEEVAIQLAVIRYEQAVIVI